VRIGKPHGLSCGGFRHGGHSRAAYRPAYRVHHPLRNRAVANEPSLHSSGGGLSAGHPDVQHGAGVIRLGDFDAIVPGGQTGRAKTPFAVGLKLGHRPGLPGPKK
jgi:hypothetical protein